MSRHAFSSGFGSLASNPIRPILYGLFLIVTLACVVREAGVSADEPVHAPLLKTRWAEQVDRAKVLPEYPRPSLVRPQWHCLNGTWEYAIGGREEDRPTQFQGSILVPFPVESHLSGVAKTVGRDQALWYRRTFEVPELWKGDRLLLHFGAVDWQAEVWVDGKSVGQHEGGYDSFAFEISAALEKDRSEHELLVRVMDPTDAGPQPRGKQVSKPGGIWYTPVTGIWQTVWLEPIPSVSIDAIRFESDLESGMVHARVLLRGDIDGGARWRCQVLQEDASAEGSATEPLALKLAEPRLWSPQDPKLYQVLVELVIGEKVIDSIESYFAFRSIEVSPDDHGVPRLKLNGKTLFQFGTLDQGWWPDGLYTAPTDEALRYDIEVTQKLGFNLIRKHVKVEPERWYWHCDRMGMLVWQDMPSGGVNEPWPVDGTEGKRDARGAEIYERELKALITARGFHPCVVAWVPFNEAWGQFQTEHWTKYIKDLDPHRLVISASGGNDFGVGDARDIHNYPSPEAPPLERDRVAILGEYGGLGLPVRGHTWQDEANWGYRSFSTTEELQAMYLRYIEELRPMIESRLAAAIYTQTTDVEVEVNGLMTYDREVLKFDIAKLAAAHQKLFLPLQGTRTAAAAAEAATIAYWRFEEGEPGVPVPHDREVREAIAARDISGHDNHLYAWAEANAPRSTDNVGATSIPLTAAANLRALEDLPGADGVTRDLYTDPGRAGTHMSVIGNYPFRDFTIEFSVAIDTQSRAGSLIGEDGKPTAGPEAPLQIGIDSQQRIIVTLIDRQGEVRRLHSTESLTVDQWSHFVVRGDVQSGTVTLGQVVKGRHVTIAEQPFDGGLVLHPGTWTVGRGFHDGQLGLDAAARLDEIRISTISLPDAWLLWTEGQP